MKIEHDIKIDNLTPGEFFHYCVNARITTGYLVTHPILKLQTSADVFQPLADAVLSNTGYDSHEAILFCIDITNRCIYWVFIHNTVRGNAQGGTRLRNYTTVKDIIDDGLRLSKAMTEKCAVAGLWWGGGKAIISPIQPVTTVVEEKRNQVFTNYGKFVASLGGAYVAAEDMGCSPEDMLAILKVCRFVTCLPKEVGGSENPSSWTAKGVFNAQRATVKYFENTDSLKGKTVLVQGVGNVGNALVKLLADAGANVIVHDVNYNAVKNVLSYSKLISSVNSAEELYNHPADIFAPCAMGGTVNPVVINMLKVKYVIGAANNQLQDIVKDAALLKSKNIIYLPDFYINRLGIINCANEQDGWNSEQELLAEVEKVYYDTLSLLERSQVQAKSPQTVALEIASELSSVPNDRLKHKGLRIIQKYVSNFLLSMQKSFRQTSSY